MQALGGQQASLSVVALTMIMKRIFGLLVSADVALEGREFILLH
jgi:hypothetical protein